MPRTGKHPLKLNREDRQDIHFQPITMTSIVHIPMLSGYWEESLKVLDLFFTSLYSSTELSFDLIIFDNHSCIEVQDYLIDRYRQGKIQQLILSEYNLKKLGALDYLFSVVQGEYVAYADSDVYFLPGWLEESIKILDAFPEAGQVSALPTIDKMEKYTGATVSGVQKAHGLTIETGDNLIPANFIEAHRASIGKAKTEYVQRAGKRKDIQIQRNGISAFVSAQDFQFTTRKSVIEKVLPLQLRESDEYYDSIYSPVFEAKIDQLDYWRLSTPQYLVHHIGNAIPDLKNELEGISEDDHFQSDVDLKKRDSNNIIRKWILDRHIIRSIIKRINTWTYKLLFEKSR